MKDFAQSRGDRPHFWPFDANRQINGSNPFVDQLAGEIDVRSILEDDDNLR